MARRVNVAVVGVYRVQPHLLGAFQSKIALHVRLHCARQNILLTALQSMEPFRACLCSLAYRFQFIQ
ncbi:unnamed protein product [Rotaria socialis]